MPPDDPPRWLVPGEDHAPPAGDPETQSNRRQVMMVVVFRARRTPEGEGEEYRQWFLRMSELARKMPGYVSHKGYVAEDGERLTLFEWESADTLRAWATHPEHLPVQELGRQKFYTQYHLQVCELVRESKFARDAKRGHGAKV
jgi:heme-degrading monooxygenase HmoA